MSTPATATATTAPAMPPPAAPAGGPPATPPAAPAAPPAAPPAPAPPKTATALQPSGEAPPAAPGAFPDNWRELLTDDPKVREELARYASPKDLAESWKNQKTKLSQGNLPPPPPAANATPEELKTYRAAHGIPDEPTGYKLELSQGLQVDEAVKPAVDAYLAKAHAAHTPPAVVNQTVSYMLEQRAANIKARQDADVKVAHETRQMLQKEWGGEFEHNLSMLGALLESGPAGTTEKLADARLIDGTPMMSDPSIMRWLVGLQRTLNPTMAVMPGSGTNSATALSDELTDLNTQMKDEKSAYHTGPKDANGETKGQVRYRQLLDAQSAIEARGKR